MDKDKTISNGMVEDHIMLENISKDINSIIDKYAEHKNMSAYSSGDLNNDKGFFLMWIKKDNTLPENERLQITTFAKQINVNEIVASMEKTLKDMLVEQMVKPDVA